MSLRKLYVNICSPAPSGVGCVLSEDEATDADSSNDESKHAEDPLIYKPLPIHQEPIAPVITPILRNKSGRPKNASSLRFRPQPQSIIATRLRLERENKATSADTQCDKQTPQKTQPSSSESSFICSKQTENPLASEIKTIGQSVASEGNIEDTTVMNISSPDRNEEIEFEKHESELQLNIHKKQHHSDSILVCDQCAYQTRAASDLRKHYCTHSGERPYACPQRDCDYKGKYSNNLDYHTRKMHPVGEPLKCEVAACGFTSRFPRALRIHVIKNHSGQKTISCDMCPYRCYLRGELRKHMVSHSAATPFACDFPGCGYACKLSTNLRKHRRIHTEERPFACEQCSFRSNFVSSLKVHKRTHTDERPYCCHLCGYRCNSASNLKKHISQRHREAEGADTLSSKFDPSDVDKRSTNEANGFSLHPKVFQSSHEVFKKVFVTKERSAHS